MGNIMITTVGNMCFHSISAERAAYIFFIRFLPTFSAIFVLANCTHPKIFGVCFKAYLASPFIFVFDFRNIICN